MSQISYNGVNLGLVRTEYMKAEPVYDPSGMDPTVTHVTIEVQSIMHPDVTASNMVPGAGPLGQPQGDSAGLSLVNLRQALMTPRKPLVYVIGPDNVIISPTVDQVGNVGVFRSRDCQDGPKVIDCRIAQIEGDFQFLIYFKIETWITGFSNSLLSNRWSVTTETDRTGLTTRYTQGQAVIRGNALKGSGGNATLQSPDDFRRSLFLPIPPNFIRDKIRCTVTPDQRTLNYYLTDTETGIAMGGAIVVVDMHGNATAGSESTINSIRTAAGKLEKMGKEALNLDVMGFLKSALDSIVPINKANCLIRVRGQRGATRVSLSNIAAVCQDRMRAALVVSAYCTQGLDSDKTPWVEVRVEFFPTVGTVLGGIASPLDFTKQMNLSDDVTGTVVAQFLPPLASNSPTGFNLAPPSDGGTRGSYVGALAVQTFAGPGAVPNLPPADAPRRSVNPL